MPELGEIKHATELGYENNNYYYTFIECPDCHKRRWEAYIHNQPRRIRCQACGIKLSKLLRGEYEEPCNPSTPPILGEIRHSRDLGKTTRYQMIQKYIYIKCPDCGIERWVCYAPYLKPSSICNKCSHKHQRGVNHSLWKGGKSKHSEGYIVLKLQPDDFFYPMANVVGYVAEHRLVMAKHLNRCLLRWEVVHHINGIRTDNRIGNLELLPHGKFHLVDTLAKSTIKSLEAKIQHLESLLDTHNIPYKQSRMRNPLGRATISISETTPIEKRGRTTIINNH